MFWRRNLGFSWEFISLFIPLKANLFCIQQFKIILQGAYLKPDFVAPSSFRPSIPLPLESHCEDFPWLAHTLQLRFSIVFIPPEPVEKLAWSEVIGRGARTWDGVAALSKRIKAIRSYFLRRIARFHLRFGLSVLILQSIPSCIGLGRKGCFWHSKKSWKRANAFDWLSDFELFSIPNQGNIRHQNISLRFP